MAWDTGKHKAQNPDRIAQASLMHIVQAISYLQEELLRSAGTWQAAAHSWPRCVLVLIVAAAPWGYPSPLLLPVAK